MPFRFHRLAWLTLALFLPALASAAPLRVGVEADLEPITFVDAHGVPRGFAIDLIDGIAREMNLDVTYVVRNRADMFADFNAGRIDAIANVVYTKERESYMAFSTPQLELRSTIFTRKGDNVITAAADLRDRRLAGIPNSRGDEYLREHGLARHLVPVPSQREAMHAVADGRADATIGTRLIGLIIIRDDRLAGLEMRDIDLPELTYQYHIVLHLEDVVRLARINEGLARLRATGAYDKIYEKWVGPLEPRRVRLKDLQPYLLPAAILLGAVLGALLWQRRLLRRLQVQTEALRVGEERLTLVLEGSEDGFWDWDLRTGYIDRSKRTAAILGYDLSEIEPNAEGWTKLIHPDDLPKLDAPDSVIVDAEGGKFERFDTEYRMIAKSGEVRWVQTRGKVVGFSEDGKANRIAGTITDITERKRTEAALRESEMLLKRSAQLLGQTQSAAQIGGWEVDLRTDRLFWTEQTYRIHEVSPRDFEPTVEKAIQFYAEESRPVISAAVERAVRDGTPFNLELDLITARQRRVRVHAIGGAELDHGRVVKIYGSFHDITDQRNAAAEREKLQSKMLEAQKLESLGVLAGGIAHDFNNLLTVILANASFARLQAGGAPDLTERLTHIEIASRRAADMCNQMLAYAGRGSFIVEPVDLNELVQDTVQLLQVSISKKARLELALEPGLPAVDADRTQLRQVVMNLVINASESMEEHGGKISLSTRRGRPEQQPGAVTHAFGPPAAENVCLEVFDTGKGMSESTLARIFDPFFTTKFAGRGLGLAAVLGIVRAHHGALTVQSSPGKGTRFRLFLPALAAAPSPAPAGAAAPVSTAPAARANQGTVLIADDEAVVRQTASAVLRYHGYQTELAPDGVEAARLFRANPQGFVAVLLDLTMPGLDGAEVLREIRSLNADVRVLLMSGYSEQDVLKRLKGQGRVAFLHKPFTQETLLARIREVSAVS